MRKLFVIGWLLILLISIIAIFWYTDLVYRLPTPVPADYKTVAIGSTIKQPVATRYSTNFTSTQQEHGVPKKKPTFLHFFNPDCPCSRFNMKHVRSLIKANSEKVNFMVVLVTHKDYTPAQIQKRFNLEVPVIKNDSLAAIYGVYSTPQAVIINPQNQLYYRGNYNRSRYCTDKKTNYAEIALASLLANNTVSNFEAIALTAYGCELPGCKKDY